MDGIDALTVEQLDRLTAEHVMGLDMESINDNYMVLFEGEAWQPTLNGSQALAVFEKLCSCHISQYTALEFNSITGWSVFAKTAYDKYKLLSTEASFGEAICRAALKVFGYDQY